MQSKRMPSLTTILIGVLSIALCSVSYLYWTRCANESFVAAPPPLGSKDATLTDRYHGTIRQFAARSDTKAITKTVYSSECSWDFVRYAPAEVEKYWMKRIQETNEPCADMNRPEMIEQSKVTWSRTVELQSAKALLPPTLADDQMSKMIYRGVCQKQPQLQVYAYQAIEPLAGMLRDPFTICAQWDAETDKKLKTLFESVNDLQSKFFLSMAHQQPFVMHRGEKRPSGSTRCSFTTQTDPARLNFNQQPCMYARAPWFSRPLLPFEMQKMDSEIKAAAALGVDIKASRNIRHTRVILIDCGASYFQAWRGNADAASTRWFVESFKRSSINFDKVIAFEYTKLDPHALWDSIPDELMVKYVPINHGVTYGNTPFNPWRLIQQLAVEQDYVVVKLDIDSPHIENDLFAELSQSGVANLIDEFFFEHHVDIPSMRKFWGEIPGLTLKDSYQTYTKLRQLGMRAHSWP